MVTPKYKNKINEKTKIKGQLTKTFSLDKFFLENFKFIIFIFWGNTSEHKYLLSNNLF